MIRSWRNSAPLMRSECSVFAEYAHNKKRLTDGSNYVILYPQNSNISYLMLYLTSDTNHEECDESCTRNTLSFN